MRQVLIPLIAEGSSEMKLQGTRLRGYRPQTLQVFTEQPIMKILHYMMVSVFVTGRETPAEGGADC